MLDNKLCIMTTDCAVRVNYTCSYAMLVNSKSKHSIDLDEPNLVHVYIHTYIHVCKML